MSDIWDPERIRIVGSVLERYSTHLAPGHRIRCGMEGDECAVYRSAAEAPCATVTEVFREPNGYVKFRAQMDGTGATVDFDNRNIAPGSIWEIEPEYLETFRGHVEHTLEGGKAPTTVSDDDGESAIERLFAQRKEAEEQEDTHANEGEENTHRGTTTTEFEAYRSSMQSEMEERFRAQEVMLRSEFGAKDNSDDDFKTTMAETVRMLAGDLLRLSRGEQPQFADRYVDRYDLALTERSGSQNNFRGEKKKDKFQGEKHDFGEVSPVTYSESQQEDFAPSDVLTE